MNSECDRYLTDFDREKARLIGLGVAYGDMRTPDCGFIAARKWANGCDHPPATYLGTAALDDRDEPVDVYLFEDNSIGGFGTCLRYGNDDGDYMSSEGTRQIGYRTSRTGPAIELLRKALFDRYGVKLESF